MTEKKPEPTTDLTRIDAGGRGLALTNLKDMQTVSQIILQSGLCPDGYKKAEQVFVALQSGAEIGLKPMQAINSIAVIRGKPSLWGDAALGLIKRSGLLKEFSEKVTGSGMGMVAEVVSVRVDGSKVTTTFDVEDAKTAKLWDKPGPWQTHPKRMLKYKARAFNLRDNFPDVLMGMHLTEEMVGEVSEPLAEPECDTAPRAERRKKVVSQAVAEKPADTEVEPEPPAEQVKDEEPAGTAITYQDVYDKYVVLGGEHFIEWAAEILVRDEVEVTEPDQFTPVMLEQLSRQLETKGI